jgi:hypothetical protein
LGYNDKIVPGIFVAFDQVFPVDFAMDGADHFLANPLMTGLVQLMEVDRFGSAQGGINAHRNSDQREL